MLSGGHSPGEVRGLLNTVAFVAEHGLCHMWNPPRQGVKPMSPALAHGFFTTELPGKPRVFFFLNFFFCIGVCHHRLNGHEFEPAQGDGEGQGSLVCCSPWSSMHLNNNKQLMNDAVTVSGAQQRGSATRVHESILPQMLLPSRLPHNTEQSSM